ncbi:MAG: hypothetical protein IKO56_07620 [Alphaproteobacteria bacterium]|nr:hypothetical protein [Alphaproteobacteria bacterium]
MERIEEIKNKVKTEPLKKYSDRELLSLKQIIRDLKDMDSDISSEYPKWSNYTEHTKW